MILGRVSNLPTVWSNCLAGWWLGGAGNHGKLPLLLAGTSMLYVGGMYLNDAFDADFDRLHRPARPIPAGLISLRSVWRFGMAWLAAGAVCLACLGITTGAIGVALLVAILLYDAVHKRAEFAPLLMGACRWLLYLAAASTGESGVTGRAVWCGFALMSYVAGLSWIARHESTRPESKYFPLLFLVAPIALALVMNSGSYREPALLLSAVVALWIVRSLRPWLWSPERNAGFAVSNLLAGIVLVDLLAAVDVTRRFSLVFLALFALCLLAQRFVPAT